MPRHPESAAAARHVLPSPRNSRLKRVMQKVFTLAQRSPDKLAGLECLLDMAHANLDERTRLKRPEFAQRASGD
jgi:hypothetical protein